MAEGGRGSSGNTWRRLGFKLVVLELATAMVLLVGAGLLGKSLYRLLERGSRVQPGSSGDAAGCGPVVQVSDERAADCVSRQIVDRIASLPGVESVGLASVLPVSFNGNTDWIRFVGRPYNGEHNEVNQREVSSELSADARRHAGARPLFHRGGRRVEARVVIINQALARRYFPAKIRSARSSGISAWRRSRSRKSSASWTTSGKGSSTRRSGPRSTIRSTRARTRRSRLSFGPRSPNVRFCRSLPQPSLSSIPISARSATSR